MRNLSKKPIFSAGEASWINELPSGIRKNNDTTNSSTKIIPVQASKQSNAKRFCSNLQDRRFIQKPKFQLGQLVRTSDIRLVFSKGDSTIYSYEVYTINEVTHDTNLSYRINYLPESYNPNLLGPTILSLDENNKVMKELNLIQ